MENNNSEKTGRLTPGQIDAVVRQSEKIRKIDEIFERSLNNKQRQVVHFCTDLHPIAVVSECRHRQMQEDGIFDDCIIVDDGFFDMVRNYFREKRQVNIAILDEVISGEGGER